MNFREVMVKTIAELQRTAMYNKDIEVRREAQNNLREMKEDLKFLESLI
jgi:hypothetical protein